MTSESERTAITELVNDDSNINHATQGNESDLKPRQLEISHYRAWKERILEQIHHLDTRMSTLEYEKVQLEQRIYDIYKKITSYQESEEAEKRIHETNIQALNNANAKLRHIPIWAVWQRSNRDELRDLVDSLRMNAYSSQGAVKKAQTDLHQSKTLLDEEKLKISSLEAEKQQLEINRRELQDRYREKDREFYSSTVERWLHPEALSEDGLIDCFQEDGMVAIHRSTDPKAVFESGYLCPGLILEQRGNSVKKFVNYVGYRSVGSRLHFGINSIFNGRYYFFFSPGILVTHKGHGGVGNIKGHDTHFSIQGQGDIHDSSHELPIDWGFVLLPQDEQSNWETYFTHLGKRPAHVYYYSEQSGEEVLAEWKKQFDIPLNPDPDALKDAYFAYFDQINSDPTEQKSDLNSQTYPVLGSCYVSKLKSQ